MKESVMKTNRRGFTLVEMLVVVAIITLLGGIVLFNLMGSTVKAKLRATKGEIDGLALQLDVYKTDLGSYPPQRWMVKALEKGLGASLNWHGPYYKFEGGRTGFVNGGGQLVNAKNGHLSFYGGSAGDAENLLLPNFDGTQVVIDYFERPLVYYPYYEYQYGKAIEDANETGFVNPTTFQIFSFGQDGRSIQMYNGKRALLSWHDGRDNNGDGKVDDEANLKTAPMAVEDDLCNW